MGDDLAHACFERDFRLPAKLGSDFRNVGPGAVRLAGPLRDVGFVTAEQLDEPVHGLRVAGAQVPERADTLGLRSGEESPRHVRDVKEIAPLRAVAHYGEGLARQLLAQEYAEHRAVGA